MIELSEGLSLARADPAIALIFGVPSVQLQHQALSTLLKLPPGTTLATLMGLGSGRKGSSALKANSRKGGVCGKRCTFRAQHADRGLLNVTLQVCVRLGCNGCCGGRV